MDGALQSFPAVQAENLAHGCQQRGKVTSSSRLGFVVQLVQPAQSAPQWLASVSLRRPTLGARHLLEFRRDFLHSDRGHLISVTAQNIPAEAEQVAHRFALRSAAPISRAQYKRAPSKGLGVRHLLGFRRDFCAVTVVTSLPSLGKTSRQK